MAATQRVHNMCPSLLKITSGGLVSPFRAIVHSKTSILTCHAPVQGYGRRYVILKAKKSKVADIHEVVGEVVEDAVVVSGEEIVEVQEAPQRVVYEAVPPTPPEYPIAPPTVRAAPTGLPPWVWVMVGVLLANVFNKVLDFVRRPKQVMSEMMMKQMANAMSSQMGNTGAPGANPFGFPPPPAPSSSQPMAYDTWATPSTAAPSPSAPPPTPPPTPASPAPAQSASSTAIPSQPTTAASPSNGSPLGFDPAGITAEPTASESSGNGSSTGTQASASFFQDIGSDSGAQSGKGQTKTGDDEMIDSFFQVMNDPSMREQLYQYLPEGMRNPETMEMVMNNPMVREQFKKMMAEKGGMPSMPDGANFLGGDEQIKQQLENMNVDPQVLIQKLMAEPDLWSLLQKPTVMSAVMDMQQNPNNVTKYMSDPEVMKVLMKMNELTFAAQAEAGGPQAAGVPQPAAAPPAAPSTPTAEVPAPASISQSKDQGKKD